MKQIVLLGATGGCADVLTTIQDINERCPDYEVLGFLDDRRELWGRSVLGVAVLGGFDRVHGFGPDCWFATAIGSERNHWRRTRRLASLELPPERFATLVHPAATVSRWARLGHGVVIHAQAAVGAGVELGDHVLLLPQSVVNHGTRVMEGTIVTSQVAISGDVTIGSCCYLGTGCKIRQDVTIGRGAMVGMGAVVLADVPPHVAVGGVPARVLRSHGEAIGG